MYFCLYKDNKGEWRWTLRRDGNHEAIAVSSESYKQRSDCLVSINLVKSHAATAKVLDQEAKAWV